jgi:hypothetical protein
MQTTYNVMASAKQQTYQLRGIQTALFQKGFLAFRSPARTALFLADKSFMISASFHVRLGDL